MLPGGRDAQSCRAQAATVWTISQRGDDAPPLCRLFGREGRVHERWTVPVPVFVADDGFVGVDMLDQSWVGVAHYAFHVRAYNLRRKEIIRQTQISVLYQPSEAAPAVIGLIFGRNKRDVGRENITGR
jgi:hypothetical protein